MLTQATAVQPIVPGILDNVPDIDNNSGLFSGQEANPISRNRIDSASPMRMNQDADSPQKDDASNQSSDDHTPRITHVSLRPCGHLFARYGFSQLPEVCPTCQDSVTGFADVDSV